MLGCSLDNNTLHHELPTVTIPSNGGISLYKSERSQKRLHFIFYFLYDGWLEEWPWVRVECSRCTGDLERLRSLLEWPGDLERLWSLLERPGDLERLRSLLCREEEGGGGGGDLCGNVGMHEYQLQYVHLQWLTLKIDLCSFCAFSSCGHGWISCLSLLFGEAVTARSERRKA